MNFLDERVPMRIWERLSPCPMSGCWLWFGPTMSHGYGQCSLGGQKRLIHRIMFAFSFGDPAPGLDVDHRCRVRCCANPAHLRAVSHRENVLSGDTFAARNAAVTSCPKGHPYDAENTRHHARGRACRQCHRDQVKAHYRANSKALNKARYQRRKAQRVSA